MSKNIKWLDKPEEHDYPAAEAYLLLIYTDDEVKTIVNSLHDASMTTFKAKDIFRASSLHLLGISNSHVEKNLKKVSDGHSLSPILLVRDPINRKVVIADGYHRLCAAYSISEDLDIPCKIV